jgi:plastocyanin
MLHQTNFFSKLHLGLFLLFFLASCNEDNKNIPIIELTIENHLFYPENVVIPADTRVKLIIQNKDATAEEFESFDLKREKFIPGKSTITVFINPLKPGVYKFFGDFHQDTAQGKIIVN